MRLRKAPCLIPIFLLLLALIVYFPAIRYGGYVWDDDAHLTNNPVVFDPHGLSAIWSQATWRVEFYPLTFTSFWLQYRVNGLDAWAYHLTNVLLHAVNAVLVWIVLKQLRLRSALLIAIVFLVHPLNVESVAWVSERKNVLMALFQLLAVLSYLRFEELFPDGTSRRRATWYLVAFLCFVAAMFSKTVACTFPAGMLVILWWKRGYLLRRDLLLLPFLVFGLALAAYTAYLETAVVGSVGAAWNYTAVQRFLIAGRAICFYIAKFFVPTHLAFSYPLWAIHSETWWQWIFPLMVIAGVVLAWIYRRSIGRGPLVAFLFFFVTISPALGFINYYTMIYSLVADHYIYLAILGLAALVVEPLSLLAVRRPQQFRTPLLALAAVALIALSLLTFQRCWVYQGQETLWQDTLTVNPQSWLAHICLGVELKHHHDYEAALKEFHAALTINPAAYQATNDIGTTLVELGRDQEAIPYFTQVIHDFPNGSGAYANLGSIYFRQGNFDAAAVLYEKAIAVGVYDADARFNYGKLLATRGQFSQAVSLFQETLKLDPRNARAHLFLARCLAQTGNLKDAYPHFQEAARLDPTSAEAKADLARAQQFMATPMPSPPPDSAPLH